MMAFGLSVTYYERGKTSLARILKVLNQREEPLVVSHSIVEEYSQRIEEGKNAQEGHSDVLIEACNLTFYYPGQSHPALKNVSFRIEKGKRTALVGTIGSGKSTIVRLLLGLYEVPPGMLFWNGVDVTSISLEKRREKIAVVPQDVFLFRETLKWNILLGTNEDTFVKDKRFYEILVKAGLEKEFQIWGLDKKIAERGLNLSGGQRARVALARAMIRNAALLILDDALSSVDIRMENEILEHLQHDAHLSQTLLMVTHRFSKLGRFDHVLVLKDGEVVQSGSPQGLARVSGLYRQLLELQRMENELAR
jgi:ATP-binding cassette subfamily B protein